MDLQDQTSNDSHLICLSANLSIQYLISVPSCQRDNIQACSIYLKKKVVLKINWVIFEGKVIVGVMVHNFLHLIHLKIDIIMVWHCLELIY